MWISLAEPFVVPLARPEERMSKKTHLCVPSLFIRSPRSARRVRGERRVLALGAPAVLPGLLVHPELDLVHVRAVAVMHLVTVRKFGVSEPRHDLEGGRIVGAELGCGEAKVEVIKEVAV